MASTTLEINIEFGLHPFVPIPTVAIMTSVNGRTTFGSLCECNTIEQASKIAENLNAAFRRVTAEEWAKRFSEIHMEAKNGPT